jgi:hypothetical protein
MNSPESSSPSPGVQEMEQLEPLNPWRPLVIPAIVVIVGLAIAWALFAHFGRSKPDASGVVMREVVYPVQVDAGTSQPEPGMEGTLAEQDEMILLVQLRLTNVGTKPQTVFDIVANVKLDGANNQSYAALPEDIDRLFQRFPDLAGMRMTPLSRHQVVAPGQSAEGLMVFNYAWSQQQWNQSKNRQIVISFQNGRSLILPLQ